MTIGIYRLCFEGTYQCYIGQSINIENRYKQHLRSFSNGSAVKKLLNAYTMYGIPLLEILIECSISELNSLELETIEIYDSYNNGFNSTNLMYPIGNGEDSGHSKYSNDQILQTAVLLTDTKNTAEEISKQTGVSVSVVRSVACLQNHSWLNEEAPDVALKLKELLGTRNAAGAHRKDYPAVRSPLGVIHKNIPNFNKFCDEHGLDKGHFSNILNGKLKSHRGWTLASNNIVLDQINDPRCGKNKGIKYPSVLSPEGVLYSDIPNAAQFCRQHSLNKTAFCQLLKGRGKTHKGWRLAENG